MEAKWTPFSSALAKLKVALDARGLAASPDAEILAKLAAGDLSARAGIHERRFWRIIQKNRDFWGRNGRPLEPRPADYYNVPALFWQVWRAAPEGKIWGEAVAWFTPDKNISEGINQIEIESAGLDRWLAQMKAISVAGHIADDAAPARRGPPLDCVWEAAKATVLNLYRAHSDADFKKVKNLEIENALRAEFDKLADYPKPKDSTFPSWASRFGAAERKRRAKKDDFKEG